MAQSWHDLLFAHWPLPAEALAPLIPPGLTLDTFDGRAWIGVIPFRMSGVRLRGLPPIPGAGAFPELNVRTYVTDAPTGALAGEGGKPGVWFFSLDAASALAVRVARAWFRLPYYRARMRCEADGDGIRYESHRTVDAGGTAADFAARYRPTGAPAPPTTGSLEHFLTERYCLYAKDRRDGLRRAEIRHAPWPLQPAEAEIDLITMVAPLGLSLPDEAPRLHFARDLDVVVWTPQPLSGP
jgi:hypothetical protein